MYLFYQRKWENMYYAFVDADGKIELLYDGAIQQNVEEYCAEFRRKGVTYKIFDNRIEVIVKGKTYVLKAISKYGSIANFLG